MSDFSASVPQRYAVLGLGCRSSATAEELLHLAGEALLRAGMTAGRLSAVASLDRRAESGTIDAVAARLGVRAVYFDAGTLERETPRLANPSENVFRAVGCHGVAEAAALAAAGPAARLVLPKIGSGGLTAAIALTDSGA